MIKQDKDEALKFLRILDASETLFTFQTFDDTAAKSRKKARIFHGGLLEHWDELVRLNNLKAGIFITVNATDLKGRTAKNIVRVRALFADLDGAPLAPILDAVDFRPHIIVESSSERWHIYWLTVASFSLEEFSVKQKKIAAQFNADPKIFDLPRVMRLPGFIHHKGEPHLVKIIQHDPTIPLYDIPPEWAAEQGSDADEAEDAVSKENKFYDRINRMAFENLAAWVLALFPEAEYQSGTKAYRVSSKSLGRDLEEAISIHPDGIKDFGVADQGDKFSGGRTPIMLVMEYCEGGKDLKQAVAWLCERLGISEEAESAITTDNFYAYRIQSNFIFKTTGDMWPAAAVDAELPPILVGKKQKPLKASVWIAKNRGVHQMTWAPGLPQVIQERLVIDGGWIDQPNTCCYNLYRPPSLRLGNAAKATPWLDHGRRIWAEDFDHIVCWLACRVQHPEIKINHSLIMGSNDHGIGKDTFLEPIKYAVGPWNFQEISAQQLIGRFNAFLKAVILRINEARDMGEFTRYQLYDHIKAYTAAPPDVLRIDEKNKQEYIIFNKLGLIITSNYKTNGIYLPPEDRRSYVAWSTCTRDQFSVDYWNKLWAYYADGGFMHVAAFLNEYDISKFDPKAPPPQTPAFWAIVNSNRANEDNELADVIDAIGGPDVLTLLSLLEDAQNNTKMNGHDTFSGGLVPWLQDRKHRRIIPSKLEQCGYTPVNNPTNQLGLWSINGVRQMVYAKATMPRNEQLAAIAAFIQQRSYPATRQ